MKRISGIYIIKNIVNNKVYVGSSRDVVARIQKHKQLLQRKQHHSYKLQEDWDKYGASSFETLLIEKVSVDALLSVEQKYIDDFKSATNLGYNVMSCTTLFGKKDESIFEEWLQEQIELDKLLPDAEEDSIYSEDPVLVMTTVNQVIEKLHQRQSLGKVTDKRLTTRKLPIELYIQLAILAIENRKDVCSVISDALESYVNENDIIHDSELKAKALAQGKTVEELLVDVLEERIQRSKRKLGISEET